jgi:signal transduction histidine kinase
MSDKEQKGAWLVGGGEMAKFIKTMDWSRTPLGPMASWPQSLRTTVSLVQASNSPISLSWGPGHVQIYNDGYWPICGAKHPGSMGQDYRECWASAFPVIGEAYVAAWSGKSAYLEKMRMFLDRNGFLEETWFTFSFSPITDESGRVGGLFHPVTEMTSQMLSERRTRTLRDLVARTAKARTSEEVFALSVQLFEESNLDLPFVLLYQVDSERRLAKLVGQVGMVPGTFMTEQRIALDVAAPRWPIGEVARSGVARQLDELDLRPLGRKVGPYPELPTSAFILPITQPGSESPAGVLVAGISSRLSLSEPYRGFCDLVAATVSNALANARAYEEQRRRAEALAEIDRAKTTFFSNVSHEFRTPLTLILGPIEDAISRGEPVLKGADLDAVHRSALRLLRLVNSLLDFSRIEAGRIQASFEPTDLSSLTAGLSTTFRSLVESAGLKLVIDCPELGEPVFVDRAQWEKIVLNLLSNAFKFTFAGTITVRLRAVGRTVELTVEDTGTGIPDSEVSHVFDRFHRVQGARGRSFEGTGIGLALVQELVKLHGGAVSVESAMGFGTTFTVSLQLGKEHLPETQFAAANPTETSPRASAYLSEAAQWKVADVGNGPSLTPATEKSQTRARSRGETTPQPRSRILVVDDNADMRGYVTRLLEEVWDVESASDGVEALERIRQHPPDLVLSDVMMPRMGGFELLAAIREDASSRTLPFVLLSARAGEEAVIEGLESGADDYLVKPFSARELLSRVRTHLEMHRMRQEAAGAALELARTRATLLADVKRKNKELEAFSYSVSHDLRAPLRSVDGFSQALLEDHAEHLDATGRDYLQRVRTAAKRMGQLIDDLIKLSRVERVELYREVVDLTQIGRRIGLLLSKSDGQRVVDFTVDEGLVARIDRGLAEILLDNLLGNAWKFTSKKEAPRISFSVTEENGERIFHVSDNGAGFDPEHTSRLFNAFQRLHGERDFPGTGIGLATVHRIVDRHGGRVWAEGKIGEGATVHFTFPSQPGGGMLEHA